MDELFGIRRAGSFACTIEPPLAPSEYSAIQLTFSQDQQIIITKNLGDTGLAVSGTKLTITLTPAETLQFRPTGGSPMGRKTGGPAVMQLRCWKSASDAPASPCWGLPVFDCNSEEAIGT